MTSHARKREDVPLRLPPEELKAKIKAFVSSLRMVKPLPLLYDDAVERPGVYSGHNEYKRTRAKKKEEARARIEWCEE